MPVCNDNSLSIDFDDLKLFRDGKNEKGHIRDVNCLVFGPGSLLASTSDDNTVRIWDVKSYSCLAVITGFTGHVNSVAWQETIDGVYLLTGSANNVIHNWQVIPNDQTLKVILRWSTHQPALVVSGANIIGAQGLSQDTYKILKQLGAIKKENLRNSFPVSNLKSSVINADFFAQCLPLSDKQTSSQPTSSCKCVIQ